MRVQIVSEIALRKYDKLSERLGRTTRTEIYMYELKRIEQERKTEIILNECRHI